MVRQRILRLLYCLENHEYEIDDDIEEWLAEDHKKYERSAYQTARQGRADLGTCKNLQCRFDGHRECVH